MGLRLEPGGRRMWEFWVCSRVMRHFRRDLWVVVGRVIPVRILEIGCGTGGGIGIRPIWDMEPCEA